MRRLIPVLTCWPFIVAVFTLLVNDAWLKQSFPGTLTGKLSDFAGIAVVALLALASAPRFSRWVHAALALAFTWWKSPWSQPLIDLANTYLPSRIGRVVDYTDLLALSMLPVCAAVLARLERFQIPLRSLRYWVAPPVAIATALALSATSLARSFHEFQFRRIDPSAELSRVVVARAVAEIAKEQGLTCTDCTEPTFAAEYSGKGIFLSYSFVDGRSAVFKLQAMADGMFVGAPPEEKADRFTQALKRRLSQVDADLEYVERLGPPRP